MKDAALIPLATLDFETDPFNLLEKRVPGDGMEVFAACFDDGKTVRVWWGPHAARDCVRHAMKFHGLVYAHNGGKFDDHFMFEVILDVLSEEFGLDEQDLHCIGKRIVSIPTPNTDFRDSYALIPKPLSAFGAKKEIEIWKLEKKHREKHKVEIIEYMRTDTTELRKALVDYFRINKRQDLTLASTAFKTLQEKFGVESMKTDERFDDMFRPAFFAGRVQFFKLGKQGTLDGKSRFTILDINSAFPWSMTGLHWFSANYIATENPPKEFKNQCLYEITCDSDGALPHREEKGGVSFPIVKAHRFFVFGWELFQAKALHLVRRTQVHQIYQPTAVRDFKDYVLYYYDKKKNAPDKAERDVAKLMLNSAYGKYGLNPRGFTDIRLTRYGKKPSPKTVKVSEAKAKEFRLYATTEKTKVHRTTKTVWRIGKNSVSADDESIFIKEEAQFYKLVFWEHIYDDTKRGLSFWSSPSDRPANFYNVATAASITSRVRAFLAASLSQVTGPLYCDTDSIICSDAKSLKKGSELGEWKLEMDCDCVWLGGKKLYVAHSSVDKGVQVKPEKFYIEVKFENYHRYFLTKDDYLKTWKTAAKGVRLNVADLIAVCEGEERTYEFEAPNLSPYSPPDFIKRTIRRADKQKKKK